MSRLCIWSKPPTEDNSSTAQYDDDLLRTSSPITPPFSITPPLSGHIITIGRLALHFLRRNIRNRIPIKLPITVTTHIVIIVPIARLAEVALVAATSLVAATIPIVGLWVGLDEGEKSITVGGVFATAEVKPLSCSAAVKVPLLTAALIIVVRAAALPFRTLIVYFMTTPPLCSNSLLPGAAVMLSMCTEL